MRALAVVCSSRCAAMPGAMVRGVCFVRIFSVQCVYLASKTSHTMNKILVCDICKTWCGLPLILPRKWCGVYCVGGEDTGVSWLLISRYFCLIQTTFVSRGTLLELYFEEFRMPTQLHVTAYW